MGRSKLTFVTPVLAIFVFFAGVFFASWTQSVPNCTPFTSNVLTNELEVLAVRELRSQTGRLFLLEQTREIDTTALLNSTVAGPLAQPHDDPADTEFDLAVYKLRTDINGTRLEFGFDDCGEVVYILQSS